MKLKYFGSKILCHLAHAYFNNGLGSWLYNGPSEFGEYGNLIVYLSSWKKISGN